MKRVFLIAGGAIGALGAVLAITPPKLSSTSSELALPGAGASAPTPSVTATATATASTPTPTAGSTSVTPDPKPVDPKPVDPKPATTAPKPTGVSGTFTGDPLSMKYGIVQVRITVLNGKITDAQAIQAPSGENDRYTRMSVPVLRERTLAAQSANISGVSGASYTSFGWYKSLVSALSQAGI